VVEGVSHFGLSYTVGGVVLVGSLVVSLVWVWGVCQVVTGLVGLGLSAS